MHHKQVRREMTAAQVLDRFPRGERIDRWANPTDAAIRLELFVEGPGPERPELDSEGDLVMRPSSPPIYMVDTIAPGAELAIPASLSQGIHQLDRSGRVIGGYAPQLRKVGAPQPSFAAGIDAEPAPTEASAVKAAKVSRYSGVSL